MQFNTARQIARSINAVRGFDVIVGLGEKNVVDEFLRIPESLRRRDLYRAQATIPRMHPNGYEGDGLDYRNSTLQEGEQPGRTHPQERFIPGRSNEGAPFLPHRAV